MEVAQLCPTLVGALIQGALEPKDGAQNPRSYLSSYLALSESMNVKLTPSCPTLCDSMDYTQFMKFSRQEYQRG